MQIFSECVVINDAYPKARCHGLVIARSPGLNGPTDLRAEHLPLLQAMQVRKHCCTPCCKLSMITATFPGLLHLFELGPECVSNGASSRLQAEFT